MYGYPAHFDLQDTQLQVSIVREHGTRNAIFDFHSLFQCNPFLRPKPLKTREVILSQPLYNCYDKITVFQGFVRAWLEQC